MQKSSNRGHCGAAEFKSSGSLAKVFESKRRTGILVDILSYTIFYSVGMNERIDLMQETLDLLVLQVLRWGPQHGHGIGQAIRQGSEDVLQVELYPALHWVEKQGWLESEWRMSEANRRARYYKMKPKGRRQLAAEQSWWKQLVRAVARTMKPEKE
jgi:PadR family transcriptional regulator, regulatory protein PadR